MLPKRERRARKKKKEAKAWVCIFTVLLHGKGESTHNISRIGPLTLYGMHYDAS